MLKSDNFDSKSTSIPSLFRKFQTLFFLVFHFHEQDHFSLRVGCWSVLLLALCVLVVGPLACLVGSPSIFSSAWRLQFCLLLSLELLFSLSSLHEVAWDWLSLSLLRGLAWFCMLYYVCIYLVSKWYSRFGWFPLGFLWIGWPLLLQVAAFGLLWMFSL